MTAGRSFKRLVRERARRTGESYTSARRTLLAKRGDNVMSMQNESGPVHVEVVVAGVNMQDPSRAFVELAEIGGDRRLPVFIGPAEAGAIAFALRGQPMPRPMTHDALKQAVDAIGGQLLRIVVGHLPETSTFTADVVVALPDGGEHHFDWRVSDAVAVAVRSEPPPSILVPARLLASPGSYGAAGFILPCPSCNASIEVADADLKRSPEAQGFAVAEVACRSCGEPYVFRLRPPFGMVADEP